TRRFWCPEAHPCSTNRICTQIHEWGPTRRRSGIDPLGEKAEANYEPRDSPSSPCCGHFCETKASVALWAGRIRTHCGTVGVDYRGLGTGQRFYYWDGSGFHG